MNDSIECPSCGRLLRAPEAGKAQTVQCPACGRSWRPGKLEEVYGLLDDDAPPPPVPNAAPSRPHDLQKERPADKPSPAAGSPQPAPAGGEPCPECGVSMALRAVVCIECGFNRQSGKRMQTVSRRVERHFYTTGLSFLGRLIAFVLLLVPAAALAWGVSRETPTRVVFLCSVAALLLVTMGTVTRLTITRDSAGKPLLITRHWFCFVPVRASIRDLSEYTTVRFDRRDGAPSAVHYLLAVVLLGVWAMGRKYETYSVEIDAEFDVDGTPPAVERVVLYRGVHDRHMRELGEMLHEVAGLRYG
jgi:hypothetical protein